MQDSATGALSDALRLWEHIFGFGDQQHLLALFSGLHKLGDKKLYMPADRFYLPHEWDEALAWARQQDSINREVYFCAHLLVDRQRKKDQAAPILALYADVD